MFTEASIHVSLHILAKKEKERVKRLLTLVFHWEKTWQVTDEQSLWIAFDQGSAQMARIHGSAMHINKNIVAIHQEQAASSM